MAPVRWGILQYRIYITNSSQTRISRNLCLEYLFHFKACKNLHCVVETLMCKISERLGNWEMSYGQTRFREIWATDEFHRDIHYNDVIMSAMASQITSLTIVYSTVLNLKWKTAKRGLTSSIHLNEVFQQLHYGNLKMASLTLFP